LPENALLIYPLFGDQVLPQGLKAVFICGMLGTILTAMVGYALVGGATIGRELVCRALGIEDEATVANWSRAGILIACLVAIPVSLFFKSVVLLWYLWAGVIIGALLIPTLVSYLSKRPERLHSGAVALSMLCGFIISLAWLVFTWSREQGQTVNLAKGVEFDIGTLLPGVAVGALALAVGSAVLGRSKP
jgi:SSS family solute:Na+ symporter